MKISITCITPVLQAILDFFPDIISFQHVFHLGVGRSQMEWKFKVKTQILVFPWAKIGQNDHSNPYIESTTVLSDIYIYTCSIHVRSYMPAAASGKFPSICILRLTSKAIPSLPGVCRVVQVASYL